LLAKNLFRFPNKYSGEVFNAGTNKKYTTKYIVEKIFLQNNKSTKNVFKNYKKTQGEILAQYMDYKKLNKFFSWKPKYRFEQVLPDLITWYKNYLLKNK
jgi:nucleoside-diphosphate-sugar epimerase